MPAIEKGRVCVITIGRRKSEVTVTKLLGENFAVVKDAKGKERKVNIRHLHPVEKK